MDEILGYAEKIRLRPIPENVETFVQKTMVLPLVETATGIKVDLIFSFTPYGRGAIARARPVSLSGIEVAFASPEDLVIHKIFASRPLDIEDVRSIVLKNKLDTGYIARWLGEFDKTFPGKNFTGTFESLLHSGR